MATTRHSFSNKSSFQADTDQLIDTSRRYVKPELVNIDVKSDSIQGGKYNIGDERISNSGGLMGTPYGPS